MELRVENLPCPVDPSLYQEAAEAYLELSHKYIEALYVFGTTTYPGLSDLDLLVVPKDVYLAPLHVHLRDRLPPRFDPIIEHEVFVVPEGQIAACRYMRPGPEGFRLVYGRDVLGGVTVDGSAVTTLCETLEYVHNKLVFLANLRRTGVLNARSCVRVFNSHRYNTQRLAQLGLTEENGYGTTIDALRTQLATAPAADVIVQMYRSFEKAVSSSASVLQALLDVDPRSVGQVAAVSQGRVTVPCARFHMHEARKRAEALTAYLQDLVRRNYWYGFPFLARLFPSPSTNSRLERALYRSLRFGSRRSRRRQVR
jgi:hypothetical protein